MLIKCWGCGVEKDTDVLEKYLFTEGGVIEDPIEPLFMIDCEGKKFRLSLMQESEFRLVIVCHSCFKSLNCDMWISQNCWEKLNPKVVYKDLPILEAEHKDITEYAYVKVE